MLPSITAVMAAGLPPCERQINLRRSAGFHQQTVEFVSSSLVSSGLTFVAGGLNRLVADLTIADHLDQQAAKSRNICRFVHLHSLRDDCARLNRKDAVVCIRFGKVLHEPR